MPHTCDQVKEKYLEYTDLRKNRKNVLSSPILVSKKKENHPSIRFGHVTATHTKQKHILFEVEVKGNDTNDFKFKLFCKDLFGPAFFRYDSKGATHWNYESSTPLKKQQINPPHFHLFNSDGVEIAYKTAALKSKSKIPKLEDIHHCLKHFCKEGNVRYKQIGFPEIVLQAGELGFNFTNDDPLKNVKF